MEMLIPEERDKERRFKAQRQLYFVAHEDAASELKPSDQHEKPPKCIGMPLTYTIWTHRPLPRSSTRRCKYCGRRRRCLCERKWKPIFGCLKLNVSLDVALIIECHTMKYIPARDCELEPRRGNQQKYRHERDEARRTLVRICYHFLFRNGFAFKLNRCSKKRIVLIGLPLALGLLTFSTLTPNRNISYWLVRNYQAQSKCKESVSCSLCYLFEALIRRN